MGRGVLMAALLGNIPIASVVRIWESGVLQNFLVAHRGNPSAAYQGFDNATFLIRERTLPNRRMHPTNVNDYQGSEMNAHLNGAYYDSIDADIRRHIVQGRIPFRPGSGTATGIQQGANGLLTRIFLLSLAEAGYARATNMPNAEGARFLLFPPAVPGRRNPIRPAQETFQGWSR